MGRLVTLLLAALAAVSVAGCGGGDGADVVGPPSDPVGIALWVSEWSVVCDLEHAKRAEDYTSGWTAYAPGTYDPGPDRRARARVAACRKRKAPPGTTVTARLESQTGDRAVVLVWIGPEAGEGTAKRMRFRRFTLPGREARWTRAA
jgi:hypothetical protein